MPKDNKPLNLKGGFTHFILLLVLTLILFIVFVAVPKLNLAGNAGSTYVLSEKDDQVEEADDEDEEEGAKPSKSEETEDEDDNNDDSDEDVDDEEDEDVIEELEFEDDEEEDEDEEEEMVEGDSEQKVEIKTENGKIVIKVKSKNSFGREVEEELEASGTAQIASFKLKVKNGEIKLKIKTEDGKVVLVEEGANGDIPAISDLPLTIDSENNVITVHTSSGDINLNQFPAGAVEAILSQVELNRVESVQLKARVENGDTKIVYHAKGEDEVKFLGLFKVEAEIQAEVNAQTGETEIVSQPWYLKYLSFLFTS